MKRLVPASTAVALALLLSSIMVIGGVSAQDVTYSSEVSIDAQPAQDGDVFTYNLSEAQGVGDFTLTLTGRNSTSTEQVSSVLGDGESTSYSVDGMVKPSDPTLTIEGVESGSGAAVTTEADLPIDYPYGAVTNPETSMVWWRNSDTLYGFNMSTQSLTFEVSNRGTLGYDKITPSDSGAYVASYSEDSNSDSYLNIHDVSAQTRSTDYVMNNVEDIAYSSGSGWWYVVQYDGSVSRVDTSTSESVGTATPQDNADDIAVTPSGNWAVSYYDGGIVEADSWTRSDFNSINSLSGGSGGILVQHTDSSGNEYVSLLDSSDGSTLWKNEIVGQTENIDITEDHAVVADSSGDFVSSYAVSDGSEAWRYNSSVGFRAVGVESNGEVVIVDLGDSKRAKRIVGGLSTTNPVVSVGGSEEISIMQEVEPGETYSTSVDLSLGESGSITASTDRGTSVDVSLNWTETTQTANPEISINPDTFDGETVSLSGVLGAGETKQVNVSEEWLKTGVNTVEVSVSSGETGPPGEIGLDYSHSAVEERTVDYSSSKWSEEYALSRTYPAQVNNATVSIPWASDRVIEVRDLTVEIDGSETSAYSYNTTNSSLTVDLGSVSEGSTVSVGATGSKVAVDGGSITVLNATTQGDPLDSRIEVLDRSSDFSISVEGTVDGDLIHHTAEESWSSPSSTSIVTAQGEQRIETDAPAGARFDIQTVPVSVGVDSGSVETVVSEHSSEEPPNIYVGHYPESSNPETFSVKYRNVDTGEEWGLYDLDAEQVIDTDTASSPVVFEASVEGVSYTFQLLTSSPNEGEGAAAVVSSGSGSSGLDLTPTVLLIGTAASMLGVFVIGRRLGIDSGRNRNVLIGIGLVIGVVAVEALTFDSVVALTVEALLSPFGGAGGSGASAAPTIGLGVLGLIGIALLTRRLDLPEWITYVGGGALTLWVLNSITGGVVASTFEQIGPLFWIILLGGSAFILYRYFSPRDIVIGDR